MIDARGKTRIEKTKDIAKNIHDTLQDNDFSTPNPRIEYPEQEKSLFSVLEYI